jgi:hypothetical protein
MSKLRLHSDFILDREKLGASRDRRLLPRYSSNGARCWFGWWHQGKPQVTEALVWDVSQGGAAIIVRNPPNPGHRVWICPTSLFPPGWVSGSVARVKGPGRFGALMGRPSQVGVRFHECCPWQAFRAAIFEIGDREASPGGYPTLPTP